MTKFQAYLIVWVFLGILAVYTYDNTSTNSGAAALGSLHLSADEEIPK